MSPYIAFEIFNHQSSRNRKERSRFAQRSRFRLGKLIVRRMKRRIRHAVTSAARLDNASGAETSIRKPATEGSAR